MKRTFTLLMASLFLITGTAWAYQLSYDKTFWTVPATSHEMVTEVPSDVFTAYNGAYSGQTELAAEKVGVYVDEVDVTGGTVAVVLQYVGGNIRLDICGIDLVAADGTVKYKDYHFGYTGGNSDGNTYTLNGVEDGSYTLRVFVPSQKEDFTNANNNSKGTMTITGATRSNNIAGSTAENKKFYYIKNVRSGKYANYEGAGVQFTQVTTPTLGSYWYLMEVADAQNVPEGYKAYRIYNAANALAVENPGSGNMTENAGVTWPAKVYCIGEHTKGGHTGVVIRALGEDGASWNDAGGNGKVIANHSYDDPGSIWEFEKVDVTESQLIQNAVAVKTEVLNTLSTEVTNTQRYYYGYALSDIEAKKAEIEAISVPETSLAEAMAGAIAISKVSSPAGLERIAPKAGDKFTMVNKGRNSGKDGLVAFAAGTDVKCLQSPLPYFDALWTLVATETEGQFKLYNEKMNVYVGVLPDANNAIFQYVTGAEEAGVYELANVEGYATFKKVGGDNNSHLHLSNWGGKEIVRWDNGDCSQWQLVKAFGPELTTDVNSPICYALKSGRGNYHFTLESNKVKLYQNKPIATDATTHWYFMLDEDGNLKMYSKSDGKAMGYLTVTDGNTKLTNDPAATDYDSDTYTLYFAPYNQTNYNGAWFALKTSCGTSYVSNHGGTSNYMGFYNEFNDAGTRIAFESIITYTLTDKVGNRYTGTYSGTVGETTPTFTGLEYTLTNEEWNGNNFTATIEFSNLPFPVSSESVTNATMISNFNAGQRWHAVGDDVKVQTAQPTNATKGEWLWAIYPKFENGAFTFTVKNVGNGKFVTLNKDASSFNTQGTVTLTENGTALEVITWLGAPCFKVPGKTLYLTINGSADSDVYLATWTGGNNNHGGNKLHFTEFVDVTGVTLDNTKATLTEAGATVTLVATVAPENATDKTVTWSTSDDKVATVDANGVVTAVANGEATITATVGGQKAECKVTVAIAVTGVTLDKETATLTAAGATVELVATVAPENAADKTIVWSTSDDKVATVVDGVVTAVANGEATITATVGGHKAECKVTVAIAVTGVTLDKETATLTAAGATVELVATVAPENAADKTIVWSTSDETIATVDQNGVVTAVANGKASITAKAGEFSATCEVTVAIAVTEVKLDKSEATLTAKDVTLALNVTVLPEDALDKTVTWTSSNEAVATVDANGVVTAVANGTATITAKAGEFSATCEVTVAIAVTEVKLDKSEATLTAKDVTLALNVTVLPEDALDKTVTWTSSNEAVATVDANGVVTAVANGTATITAKAGDFSATCEVTVAIAVTEVKLDKSEVTLTAKDATLALNVTVLPENALDKTVTWTSSDENVATVDENGVVTAVANGTATITAKAGDFSATCEVTVAIAVTEVKLDKSEATLTAKDVTLELNVTVLPEDALDKTVTWTSSNTEVATVDENGVVTAVANGTATITAKAGDFSATCEVTVAIAVTEVKLDKSEATLTAKDVTLELNVTVLPEDALDKTVTWTSSNTEVATVDENGVVTAVANGTATITAKAGDFSATCEVTVAIAVTEVKLDKSEATLTAKDVTLELNVTVLPEDALDKTVTWTSSNTEVATVDENGVVTAVANGKSTITAKAGDFSATCEVTVAIAVTEVKLDKSEATLTAKDVTLELNVTVLPEDALDKTVTWTSSNTEVATVDENGVVTAVAEGTATITAKAGEFSATCEVTVEYASYDFVLLINGEEYFKQSVKCGTDLATIMTTVAEPTKEGHTFSGWSEIPEIMPTTNITVTGSFTVNKYTVTFKIGEEVIYSAEMEYGATIVAPEVEKKEGYTFSGWGEVAETVPAEAVTYEGAYSVNKYKVYYIIDGEVVFEHEVEYGAAIEIPEELEAMYPGFEWIGEDPEEVYETMPAYDICFTGNDVTGLDRLSIDSQTVIYDLSGRRVLEVVKGFYIINGKKVFVK